MESLERSVVDKSSEKLKEFVPFYGVYPVYKSIFHDGMYDTINDDTGEFVRTTVNLMVPAAWQAVFIGVSLRELYSALKNIF